MSDVPQNIILTDVGIDAIKLDATASNKSVIGSVRFGDSAALVLTPAVTNVAGSVVYTASAAQIYVAFIGRHEVILRCQLDNTVGDFSIGSFAFLNNANVPLWVGRMEYQHKKMKTTTTDAGGRFSVQFKFDMMNISTYFDFSNLVPHYASFDTSNPNISNGPLYPVHSMYSELQVDTLFQDTGRSGYPLIQGAKGLQWFTSPFQMKNSDADFHEFDGGVDGDGHKYV